jgi:TolB-like protein
VHRGAFVTLLLAAALSGAAGARAEDPAPAVRRPKLAVTEIRAPTGDPALTALLSEMALTEASSARGFSVIGQSDVAALLGLEKQRQMLGCSDGTECFAEIGGALGADFLLVGTAGRLGAVWRIDLKLVDVKRATVVARAGESVEPSPERLAEAMQRGVRQLLAATGVAPPAPAGLTRRTAGWIVAGSGAALLAGGATFGLLSRSSWNDLQAAERSGDAAAWYRARNALRTRTVVADILTGAGIAGAGAGAWLLLGGPKGPQASVSPAPGGAVAALGGSF